MIRFLLAVSIILAFGIVLLGEKVLVILLLCVGAAFFLFYFIALWGDHRGPH